MDLKIIVMFTLRTYLSRASERESLPIHPQDFSVFVLNLAFFSIDVEYCLWLDVLGASFISIPFVFFGNKQILVPT